MSTLAKEKHFEVIVIESLNRTEDKTYQVNYLIRFSNSKV